MSGCPIFERVTMINTSPPSVPEFVGKRLPGQQPGASGIPPGGPGPPPSGQAQSMNGIIMPVPPPGVPPPTSGATPNGVHPLSPSQQQQLTVHNSAVVNSLQQDTSGGNKNSDLFNNEALVAATAIAAAAQQQAGQQQQQQPSSLERDYYGCYCLKFIVKNGTHTTEEKVLDDFGKYGEVVDIRGPGLFSGLRGNHVYVR